MNTYTLKNLLDPVYLLYGLFWNGETFHQGKLNNLIKLSKYESVKFHWNSRLDVYTEKLYFTGILVNVVYI